MSLEQIKQGLLLHLQTNRNFIQQKIYKQFAKECLQQHQLKTLNHKKIITTIKFVFDFGSNQQIKSFYQKLNQNINNFTNQLYKDQTKLNQDGKIIIDLQNLYDLMVYCVNNGFEKPKPKEVEKQAQKKQQIKQIVKQIKKVQVPQIQQKKQQEPKKQQKKKAPITILNPELQAKIDKLKLVKKVVQPIKVPPKISTRLQVQKIPPKSLFKIQIFQMPNIKVGPRYLMNSPAVNKKVQEQIVEYQPIDLEFIKNQINKKIMRDRFQKLYQHYCTQQQNTGRSATFDKIKSEMEHMTLGKFLLFCSSTYIFKNSKKIKKQILLNIFKKIAQGKPQINFQKFQQIIKDLDKDYMQQMNINATYEARLKLNSNQGYKQFKKHLNIIFDTRDNQNKDNKLFSSDFGHKGITSHSGKIQQDLKQDLINLKYSQTIATSRYKNQKEHIDQRKNNSLKPKTINLEQISLKQWPKIDWLQQQFKRQKKQKNGSIFNSKKDIIAKLKKRVKQVSKLEKTIDIN